MDAGIDKKSRARKFEKIIERWKKRAQRKGQRGRGEKVSARWGTKNCCQDKWRQ